MRPFLKVGELLRRYFIPSEENGYAPHILQKAAAGGILVLILLTFTLVNIQSIVIITSSWLSSAILPAVLIDLTNENRLDESLGALKHNPLLDEAARLKAEDMARHEYFAHDSPDGVTPWYWFGRVGYDYTYAGENLAVHFSDSDEVVKAWMKSPGHRANILSGNYTEIGIGTAKGEYKGSPTIFVAQLFGRPLTSEEKVRVAEAEAPQVPPATVVDAVPTAPLDTTTASSGEEGEGEVLPREDAEVVIDLETDTSLSLTPSTTVATVTDVSLSSSSEQAPDSLAETALVSSLATPQSEEIWVLSDVATISPHIARGILTIPIGESGGNTAQVRESTLFTGLAVRPHMVMTLVYSVLALFILGSLGISIALEWRRHHPVQVAYGVGLVAAMWVAFYVHTAVLSGALIAKVVQHFV